LFAAIKQGFFRDEGLDIDTTPTNGGAAGIPGLIAGSFDIVYGNVVSTLLAAQQGLDLKVVAPGTKIESAATDTSDIVVRRGSGIVTGKDLEGKSVGVNTRNNVIWLYARAWIKATGGNPDLVTYREVPPPQMEDALRQRQIDAGYLVSPYSFVTLQKPDFEAIAKPYSFVQPGVDVGQYLTTGAFLAQKPKTAERFVRGLRRGIEWYNSNRSTPEVREIVSGFTKVDADVLKIVTLAPSPLRSDPSQMAKTMQLMIENKLLRAPVEVAPLVAATAL
jgi:NitT/TauT family transport system substrate-binding protein